jgi:hypothetical protein
VAPGCCDSARNPGTRSWFKATATELLVVAEEYLELLDRYRVPWVELRSSSPGRVVYEDEVQVVAVPHLLSGRLDAVVVRPRAKRS